MFAEDIGLLPDRLFTNLLTRSKDEPPRLAKHLRDLFDAMCEGGDFWGIDILHFNGGRFRDADVVELTTVTPHDIVRPRTIPETTKRTQMLAVTSAQESSR